MTEVRDSDFYQRKIALTPEQKKAWSQLVRSVNKCRKEKIFFYQVLDSLCGLNGRNVQTVADYGALPNDGRMVSRDSPNCLQILAFPSVKTSCSFADDNHFVLLNDEYW